MVAMRRPASASPLVPVAIAAVSALVFLPVLRNGFVWDDVPNLVANPHYRGLDWEHLRWIVTALHLGHYIPVTWLSFAIDHAVWGLDPLGYHLTNLILHAVNAALFYVVARRLLGLATTLVGGPLTVAAAAAALVFAIHPLRVESVAWVTERRDLLSGGLVFVTTLLYLGAAEREGAARRRRLAAAVITFALALAAKSIVMTLPAVFLLLNVYPLGRLSVAGGWPARRRVLWELTPFFLLSALAAVPAVAAQMPHALGTYPWPTRIVVAVYALWFYLVRTLAPVSLSPLYEVPIPLDPWEPRFVVAAVGVLGLSVAAMGLWRRWPAGLALWLYYVVVLSPTLGIAVRAGFQLAADRYSYLGCLGWALLAGAGAGALARARERGTISRAVTGLAVVGSAVVLIGLGALSWRQAQIWRSNDTLWTHAVRMNPDCALCQTNLGLVRLAQDAPAEALAHLSRAVERRPDRVLVRGDLGTALERLGRLPEAVAQYEAVVAVRPDAGLVRQQLALALYRMGRQADGVEQLRIAGRLAPDDATLQVGLGFAFTRMGRPADAVPRFARAVELGGPTAAAHMGLIEAYLALGRPALAREALETLRSEDPELARRLEAAVPPRSP